MQHCTLFSSNEVLPHGPQDLERLGTMQQAGAALPMPDIQVAARYRSISAAEV